MGGLAGGADCVVDGWVAGAAGRRERCRAGPDLLSVVPGGTGPEVDSRVFLQVTWELERERGTLAG
jgi:hypothetical protein